MTAFDLQPVLAPPGSVAFAVELRGTEPFLDHHRPSGHPLFGTVMGIELMARAAIATASAPSSRLARISDVTIRSPIIVQGSTATAFVTVAPLSVPDDRSFACTIESRSPLTEIHFSALIQLGKRPHPPTDGPQPDNPTAFADVDASAIYSLFFHGPGFQVINAARLARHTLIGRLATGLAELSSEAEAMVADPQLIEGCLQTAGLFEVATRTRMMIPHHIDSIEFFDNSVIGGGRRAIARGAKYRSGAAAMDVDVFAADNSLVLCVRGYETMPLPFPADESAVAALCDAFRRRPAVGG